MSLSSINFQDFSFKFSSLNQIKKFNNDGIAKALRGLVLNYNPKENEIIQITHELKELREYREIASSIDIDEEDIPIDEVKKLYRGNGGWMVLNFEYMNKSKKDENNETFNHKITIFDILVFDSNYMIGSTFENRINLF